jgi:hypothetical protein
MMNVVVMRRDLSESERAALQQAHPDEVIIAHRMEPGSADEHLANCRQLDAQIAFLPHEQPIPVPAMKAGVKHLLLKDGKLLELVRVVPEFKPYEPT